MTRTRYAILIVAAAACALAGLYLPWQTRQTLGNGASVVAPAEHAFLFSPPSPASRVQSVEIDWSRLAAEWLVLLFVTIGALLVESAWQPSTGAPRKAGLVFLRGVGWTALALVALFVIGLAGAFIGEFVSVGAESAKAADPAGSSGSNLIEVGGFRGLRRQDAMTDSNLSTAQVLSESALGVSAAMLVLKCEGPQLNVELWRTRGDTFLSLNPIVSWRSDRQAASEPGPWVARSSLAAALVAPSSFVAFLANHTPSPDTLRVRVDDGLLRDFTFAVTGIDSVLAMMGCGA